MASMVQEVNGGLVEMRHDPTRRGIYGRAIP
jgi:hypothetical protein